MRAYIMVEGTMSIPQPTTFPLREPPTPSAASAGHMPASRRPRSGPPRATESRLLARSRESYVTGKHRKELR